MFVYLPYTREYIQFVRSARECLASYPRPRAKLLVSCTVHLLEKHINFYRGEMTMGCTTTASDYPTSYH